MAIENNIEDNKTEEPEIEVEDFPTSNTDEISQQADDIEDDDFQLELEFNPVEFD